MTGLRQIWCHPLRSNQIIIIATTPTRTENKEPALGLLPALPGTYVDGPDGVVLVPVATLTDVLGSVVSGTGDVVLATGVYVVFAG